jgi:hypothetical protein
MDFQILNLVINGGDMTRVYESSLVAPTTNVHVPLPIDGVSATSQILEVDVKELENVKGGHKASRFGENCAKNVFNKWKKFCGFGTKRSITNVSKDPNSIKELVDMLAMFILKVAKKDGSLYPLTK